MIDQKNLVFAENPLESNFVDQSAVSPLNVFDFTKINQNTCFKVGVFLSLAAVSLPSLNQAAQAETSNLKFQNLSNTHKQFKQFKRVNLVANRQKSPQVTEIESSVKSPQLIHVVKRGDTIYQIAKKYQVSKDELVKLNQIKNSNIIFVDQQLKIPTKKADHQISFNSAEQPETILASTVTPANISPQTSQQNLSKLTRKKPDSDKVQDDPYITKLKAGIELLRAQNKLQKSSSKIEPPFSPPGNNNLQSNLLPESAIALRLPPLRNPEEYLPSAFDGYIWPAQGVLTSGYGMRWGRLHQGIDIAAPVGTPILAAAAGEVVDVGWYGGYGNLVKLKHLDGSSTLYAHNHRNLVSLGQQVSQGEQIAEMGNTGHSTGPHLHFEIHTKDQGVIDPLALLSKR